MAHAEKTNPGKTLGENQNADRVRLIGTSAASAALSAVVCLAALACAGCIPFGNGFPEGWDCFTQYVEYLDWYRGILAGGNDLFYSFGKSLGGSMVGIFGYYLASPLNLLIVFFPEGSTPLFMVFVGVVKIALAGLTMSLFLSARFNLRGLLNIALSCGYALCAYVANWMFLGFMWIDAVVMLPLVALGMYRWMTERKRALFVVAIFLSIVCCWYTGYMLCLFAALFFLCEYATLYKGLGARAFFVTYVRYLGLLLVGVLLSAFLLLPVVFAQMGGESVDYELIFYGVFKPLGATGALFMGEANFYSGAPQLFAGTLALIGCFLFLFNRNVAPREKVARGVFFLFLLACAYVQAGNEIWCGLRIPRGYDCRFAFILAFVLVSAAGRSLAQMEGLKLRSVLAGGGIVALLAIAGFVLKTFASTAFFAGAFLLVIVATACLAVLVTVGRRSSVACVIACAVLLCATAVEMGANMSYIESSIMGDSTPVQTYSDYRIAESARYQELLASDKTWWRMEKTYSRLDYFNLEPPDNEGLILGYSGVSTYSSAPDEDLYRVLSTLGYSRVDMGSANYQQPIVLSDALLGIKYVMNDDGSTWQNPWALSLGYASDKAILGSLEDASTTGIADDDKTSEGSDPFVAQNKLISMLLGRDVEVFKPLSATQTALSDDNVTWTVDVQGKRYAYAYVNTSLLSASDLSVNGNNLGEYDWWESYYVFSLGAAADGSLFGNAVDQATVSLTARTPHFASCQTELLAYYADEAVLNEVMGELAQRQMDVKEFRDGYVSATFSSDSDTLLFTTVPYDEGWSVSVNGLKVDYQKAAGAFIAIPVSAGESDIVMTYNPKGLVPGAALSIATLVGLVIFACVRRKRNARDEALAS